MTLFSFFSPFPGLPELALEVSTDPEHKFELAVHLKKLDLAVEIAKESDSEAKWKQLADLSLVEWKVTETKTREPAKKEDRSRLCVLSLTSWTWLVSASEKQKILRDSCFSTWRPLTWPESLSSVS